MKLLKKLLGANLCALGIHDWRQYKNHGDWMHPTYSSCRRCHINKYP